MNIDGDGELNLDGGCDGGDGDLDDDGDVDGDGDNCDGVVDCNGGDGDVEYKSFFSFLSEREFLVDVYYDKKKIRV